MLKNILFSATLVCWSLFVEAQDSTFYSQKNEVFALDSADRYSVGQIEEETQLYLVRSYEYKDKRSILKSETRYTDNKTNKLQGTTKDYFQNGKLSSERFYNNGQQEGREVNYDDNGKIFYERFYAGGKREGNFKMYYGNGKVRRDETYKFNELVSGKMYDSTGVEIPYCGEFEVLPQYTGGVEAMMKYLSGNITFPKDAARSRKFRSGKVYLTFTIYTDGSVRDVEVLKSLFPSCDAEAIRVVTNMPPWQPGYQECRPVRVKYNMPISFTID